MLASERAKADGQKPSGFFTVGYKEGFGQWWAGLSPALAEKKVMSFIPYLRQAPTQTASEQNDSISAIPTPSETVTTDQGTDPWGTRRWQSNSISLSGKNRSLNEFSVERLGEDTDNNLVMVHGYGAGLGFFYRNFDALSRLPGWRLYALDMLGMGRSSRPTFKLHAKDRQAQIKEAEDWFVDSLEEWRVKKGINRFTLLGHSLGGYISVAYALKYPGHLNKLILASPVGIPEDPYAVNADMPEPGDSSVAQEFSQDALDTTKDPEKTAGSATTKQNSPPNRRPLSKVVRYLWDANISPFSLVRLSGPFGPRLVSGWTGRRFNHLPEEHAQALHDYAYSLFRQPGSGEYALAYILAPGAFARSPLIRRIQGVGRQWIEPAPQSTPTTNTAVNARLRETGVPIVLMYGEHDWMDVAGGYAAEAKINAEKTRVLEAASPEEKAKENGDVKVVIIRKAGHHVYLDNHEHFDEIMTDELKDVERREKRLGFSHGNASK